MLGDKQKKNPDIEFIVDETGSLLNKELFGNNAGLDEYEEKRIYKINEKAFGNPDSYKRIYMAE